MKERTTLQGDHDDTLALVKQMQSLLFFKGMWHARANESDAFHKHEDPRGAMRLALGLDKAAEESVVIRQRLRATGQVAADQPDRRRARSALWDDE